ncbi:U2-type spliceosomal complex subunit CWC22 SCDLUD_004417 [Saccharomycodes ludwigii]|uniref:U2-type spliceosomal complex subunit CWC22 n=1 Tax=Saccharomycodes ludwigii TaxID=36035 RepID=UPI001E8505FB|nr:hypothetical protein SCDLUD_004417 [Saccharomycodes ludwigii]KAH3898996.1 hypothetical protein SCDLUD_004417 [Saccharomycodes ludwigii]
MKQQSSFGYQNLLDLICYINTLIEELGASIATGILKEFYDNLKNKDTSTSTDIFLRYICALVRLKIMDEVILLEIIQEFLAENNYYFVSKVLLLCGDHIFDSNKSIHDLLINKLNSILNENIDTKTNELIISLLDEAKVDYKHLRLQKYEWKYSMTQHVITLDTLTSFKFLTEFQYDENFDQLELDYQKLYREKIIPFFEQIDPDINEKKNDENTTLIKVTDMSNTETIEFKKKIYLIIKGSLSGDEAAHKLLKLRLPDFQKPLAVDVIIKSSSQETTYSKFYGILAEKLCNTHSSWQKAFKEIFIENYNNCNDYEPNQLRNIGKFWGHLLATDYVGFEVFQCIHMNQEETTPAGRVYIKFIFQELVADLGVKELKEMLEEPYIQPYISNMFPKDDTDPEKIRFSINYFTAIKLGILTEPMREKLLKLEQNKKEIEGGFDHKNEFVEANRERRRRGRRRRSLSPERRISANKHSSRYSGHP